MGRVSQIITTSWTRLRSRQKREWSRTLIEILHGVPPTKLSLMHFSERAAIAQRDEM